MSHYFLDIQYEEKKQYTLISVNRMCAYLEGMVVLRLRGEGGGVATTGRVAWRGRCVNRRGSPW